MLHPIELQVRGGIIRGEREEVKEGIGGLRIGDCGLGIANYGRPLLIGRSMEGGKE
jgi:hypothetical protein